jgi:peptide/nickel transport system substrate-binding protein
MTHPLRPPKRWLAIGLAAALSVPAAAVVAQDGEPVPGGTITYVTFTNVENFNPRMLPEGVNFQVGELINRGLTEFDYQGNIITELAEKIPDPADGDVSEDLLTVTWKLKEGLLWSDGEPLTSDDLRFTWEVCGDAANGCAKSEGLVDVESVDTPDDQTIVLHYRRPYFDYKTQFQAGILPRHSADVGAPADITSWAYNQTANPNLGPFSVVEYVPGTSVRLEKNPNFYLAGEGKPYLDAVNIIMRDSPETFRQAIMNGEADVSPWLTQPAPAQVTEFVERGFVVGSGSSPYFNRFQLNLWDPNDPTRMTPHPILGDAKVREAIIRGTNTDNVIFNWEIPGVYDAVQNPNRFSMHGAEYSACDIQPVPYDLDAAMTLLDEAGWTDSDGDGVRDKDGQKLSLRVSTYTGFGQEDNVVVWIDELANLGIEGIADPIDVGVFYSSFADGSPVFTGDFDLLYYDYAKDFGGAQNEAEAFYSSTMIPSAENPLGRNMNGVQDEQVDAWVEEAGQSLDVTVRADLYCQILKRVGQELWADHWNGIIPNFQMANPKLKGWHDGELYVWFGSDSESWYLEP